MAEVAQHDRARRRTGADLKRKGTRKQTPQSTGPLAKSPPTQDVDTRTAFFEQARHYTRYLGVGTDEGKYVVATRSHKLGKHLFEKQKRPEFGVLRRAVTVIEALIGEDAITGRLFVDVGANIGTSTISALLSHRFGSAVCCEPEDENYRLLRASIALNDLEQVVTFRVAVSNRVGRASLIVLGGPPGKTWVVLDPQQIRDREAARAERAAEDPTVELKEMTVIPDVELVTLDRLAESGFIHPDRVGMLWIDAEGHEGHVLDGADTLVDRGVPIVLEFHPAGLEKHGGRDMVHEVAEESYTHFVDLRRRETNGAQPRFQLRPVAELPRLADRFLDPSTPASYTDLLMLRLDTVQANAGAKLPELMHRRR